VLLEKGGVGLFIDFMDGRIKAALHVGEHIKRTGYKHLYRIHLHWNVTEFVFRISFVYLKI